MTEEQHDSHAPNLAGCVSCLAQSTHSVDKRKRTMCELFDEGRPVLGGSNVTPVSNNACDLLLKSRHDYAVIELLCKLKGFFPFIYYCIYAFIHFKLFFFALF